VAEIIPYPSPENLDLALYSEQEHDMYETPRKPCDETAELNVFPFDERAIAPHRRHDAHVAIAIRFQLFPPERGHQVFGQVLSLRDGDSRQLRMSVFVRQIVVHDGQIADSENIVVSPDPVEGIDADAVSSLRLLLIDPFDRTALDAAGPD